MRICLTCGNQFPDDANFCPMDATKLPEPVAPPAAVVSSATIVDMPRPLAGRFLPEGLPVDTVVGPVHRATDLQGSGPVDVLVVDPRALPTVTIAERAVREVKQLAKVKSDKLLRVVDAVKGDDGRVYVATEPCKDPTLEQVVKEQGPLSLERAKEILLSVGEALAEAQKVGVIHRDLAPRNIHVGERVRLGGFAVAEPVDERIFGAPAFLSPEQAEGKPVDQRSNIYSLGALFYYMVTGAAPFDGDGKDPASIVQQHLHAQPAPPSQRAAGLPVEVDKVVLKALEKSGGRRHLTLRQLLSEVEALVIPPPASATPAPKRESSPVAKTIMAFAPGDALQAAIAEAQAARASASSSSAEGATASAKPAKGEPASSDGAGVRSNAEKLESPVAGGDAPATEAPKATASPVASTVVSNDGDAIREQAAAVVAAKAKAAPEAPAPEARPASNPVGSPAPKKKGGFRETAWFKRGELEEELARQAAALSEKDPLAGTAEAQVVVDEATLTTDDRQRLSLKTGRTEMMQAIKPGVVPGDQMSDEEMLAELDTSKKPMVFVGIGAAVVAILTAVYFLVLR